MNYFKKIIFILIILLFSVHLFGKNITIGYFQQLDSKRTTIVENFIKGIKSAIEHTEFINLEKNNSNNIDIILIFSENDYFKAKDFNKRMFYVEKENKVKNFSDKNMLGILTSKLPYYNIIMKIKSVFEEINSIGIVIHNKTMIKDIAKLRVYDPLVKIYEVSNKGSLLYNFNKAVNDCDFTLLLPDKFVFNYFSFQKIMRILNRDNSLFCGFSKMFLKYGAAMAFEIDYFKEGERIGKFLKKVDLKHFNKIKIFNIENIRYYMNK